MVRRLAITTLAAVAAAAVAAAPAYADPSVDEVADALNSSHVYIDPDATGVTDRDAELMSQAAENVDTPVYFVVFPEEEFTSQAELGSFMAEVQQDVGDGSYLVFIGNTTAADSTVLSPSDVAAAEEAAQRMSTVPDAAVAFANEAEAQADAAAASGIFGMVLLGLFILAIVGTGFFLYRSKKKREAQAARELAEVKKAVAEDVTLLGEDIARLDLDLSTADEATREDYAKALNAYDRAKAELETITRADEIQRVTNALEDGRYYMTATRARLAGEPVPERRAPCFFNPQHGPSVRDIDWAPPGGAVRSVPACQACASAVLLRRGPRLCAVRGRLLRYGHDDGHVHRHDDRQHDGLDDGSQHAGRRYGRWHGRLRW
jgi:cbb3-type cytochrome oxidase subunit 3